MLFAHCADIERFIYEKVAKNLASANNEYKFTSKKIINYRLDEHAQHEFLHLLCAYISCRIKRLQTSKLTQQIVSKRERKRESVMKRRNEREKKGRRNKSQCFVLNGPNDIKLRVTAVLRTCLSVYLDIGRSNTVFVS